MLYSLLVVPTPVKWYKAAKAARARVKGAREGVAKVTFERFDRRLTSIETTSKACVIRTRKPKCKKTYRIPQKWFVIDAYPDQQKFADSQRS